MTIGAPLGRTVVPPLILASACIAFGLVASALPNPLLAVAALGGIAFMLATILAPVAGLTAFVVLTFVSQISGIGATVSVAKGAGAALVLAWLYRGFSERRFVTHPAVRAFAFAALAFIAWSVLSALWASDRVEALSDTARLAQGPLLVVVVSSFVRTRRAFMTICIAFIAGAAVSALAGMGGLTQSDQTEQGTRLTGGIGDPNFLAAILVPAIVMSLFMTLTAETQRVRLLAGFCGLAATAGVFLTQSRGGVIALGVAVIGALVVAGPLRRHVLVAFALVGAFACFYLILIAPPQSFSRITAFTAGGGAGRADIWTVAAHAFKRHPVAGIGAGNFTIVEQQYAVDVNQNLPQAFDVIQLHEPVHNTYLQVATELGVIGLISFLLMLWIPLRACWRAASRVETAEVWAIGRGLVVGSLGMLVAFVFLTAQYEKQLWLVIALLLVVASSSEPEADASPSRPVQLRALPSPAT
jgi:O-antigen ligase